MVSISELKRKRVRKVINDTIEIYNPNQEEMEKLISFMKKHVETGKEINIDGIAVIKEILPIVSNIVIDTFSDDELKSIIEEPSHELELATMEVKYILNEVTEKIIQQTKILSEMTTEQIAELLKLDDITMTDEEWENFRALEEKARKSGRK